MAGGDADEQRECTIYERKKTMAKYYVESGTMQLVTDADDDRGAALWAMHLCMEQVLPVCPEDPLPASEKSNRIKQRGCYVLDRTIRTSEMGFGREDARVHETGELFAEWNQLLTAMTRLERRLQAVC
ncbi:MAG: hypothetical protein EA424_10280 [Planctomycetaceae bacterium]|nr:MAG: hypothetical protein EA424_10280 [Planctomycetaceae bacterium]